MNYLLLASFSEIASFIGYIAIALLVLLLLITVHEFGHYITGKIFKFKIDEFAIGFGPKLFKKTKKDGEVFSVRLLPLGGFCAFNGEDEEVQDQNAFNNKKPWQRIIVLIAGAFMNYLTAVILIVIMFSAYGSTAVVTYYVDGPTEQYQAEYSFEEKDVIIKAEGKNVYLSTDLMDAISGKDKGELVEFTIIRNRQKQKVNVMLREHTHFDNVEDVERLHSALGISFDKNADGDIVNSGLYATGVKTGFFDTLGRSFEYSIKLAGTIFKILGQLITGTLGISSMGGTVTTVSVTATAIKVGGLRNLLNIASFIGVNLAVFNLLPFPALDGSRVVFTTIEWIRGKPVNRRVEGVIHTIGFALLLAFAVFVDLQRCF